MLIDYVLGQTSIILRIKLRKDGSVSGSIPGNGLTGLTNVSAGLTIGAIADNEATTTSYTSAGATIDTIATLGTFAAPTATHCRFRELDATNHKGVYEIQLDNARYNVSNAKSLTVSVSGPSGMAECDVTIPLRQFNQYSATPDINVKNYAGTVVAAPATAGLPDVNLKNISNVAVSTSTAQLGVNVVNWNGNAVAVPNVAGVPKVDVVDWLGTTVTAATAGIPDVNTKNIGGSASIGSAGYVGIDWGQITNKTATVALTNTTISITQTVSNPFLFLSGTSRSGNTVNTLNLAANTGLGVEAGMEVLITGGTAQGEARIIVGGTGLGGATPSVTVDHNWSIIPGATDTYNIYSGDSPMLDSNLRVQASTVVGSVASVTGTVGGILGVTFPTNFGIFSIDASGRVDIGKILGTASAGAVGYMGIDWGHINAPTTVVNLSGTTIASVSGSVGSISGVTFPTNFNLFSIDTSGRIDLGKILGTASQGAAGYVGIDWNHILNPAAVVNLSNTTVAGGGGGGTPAQIAAAILATPITSAVPNTIGGAMAKIGTSRVTVVSPISEDSNLVLIKGDSYLALFGRAIQWINDSTVTAGAAWPDLTGMKIQLEINEGQLIAPGIALIPSGTIKKAQVELTSRQTNALGVGVFDYNLVGIFTGTGTGTGVSRMTLASGQVAVMAREDQP